MASPHGEAFFVCGKTGRREVLPRRIRGAYDPGMSFTPDEDRGADAPRELTLAEAIETGDARQVLRVQATLRLRAARAVRGDDQVLSRPMTREELSGWASLG